MISDGGIDFGGWVDLSRKWFVLLQLVRMGKMGLEEGGCGNSWDVVDGVGVRRGFAGGVRWNERCSVRVKWDMRENA